MVVYVVFRQFMEQEIFLRGAITIGSVYHNGSIAFGPAISEGYLLEEDVAIYPRCVIQPKVLEECLKTCRGEAGRFQLQNDYRLCEDGVYAYDFFGQELQLQGCLCADGIDKCLQKYTSLIENRLAAYTNPRILAKYAWLQNDLQRAVKNQGRSISY